MADNKTSKIYNPGEVEAKWQKVWDKTNLYKTLETPKNKKYVLDMFPYPSGASLHVGHVEGYVGTDIVARYERMKGSSVLHPMGWDAFGLPAENYAIKTGIHPEESTAKNIQTFKRQLQSVGLSYDWDLEINACDPGYYKWNQWLFIQLFKRGLAYKAAADVNWCPSCETVLANEQVVDGKCERCETAVELKKLDQWFFKITAYADRLIDGLNEIDWLEEVKIQQRNWIGRSEGATIRFQVSGSSEQIEVFTTRPDTLYGTTFMVIAPDSPLVDRLTTEKQKEAVSKFIKKYQTEKTGLPAEALKAKEGVFTGSYVQNPANGKEVPVYISNYVVSGYGSQAVMGVPAHDTRDFEFAKKYDLPIVNVIARNEMTKQSQGSPRSARDDENVAYTGVGEIINSEDWNGLTWPQDREKILASIEEKGWGKKMTTYHLRDWLISRQRYWGTPIPMVYCQSCAAESKGERKDMHGWYCVSDDQLPVELPKDVDFNPKGQSPIARSKSFQKDVFCPECGAVARREVDTMDGYVDSSWYYIRFTDPKNDREFAGKEAMKKWLPVDVYVGGGHVVQHLLFARFFWKVLFDAGLLDKSLGDEPFLKLRAPGWILGPDSRKMSKRWNNVVTPDDIIPKYGADTLRMYEMFMGPFDSQKPWSLTGVEGMWRFLNKVWRLFGETSKDSKKNQPQEVSVLMNKLVQKVSEDIENMSFNTAISEMMIAYNNLFEIKTRGEKINWQEVWDTYLKVLAPFAPHMTEELWQQLQSSGLGSQSSDTSLSVLSRSGKPKTGKLEAENRKQKTDNWSIHFQPWPEFDPAFVVDEFVAIPVQINGKHRGTVEVSSDEAQDQSVVEEKARSVESVAKHLTAKPKKVIFIPGKTINFVTKQS